MTITIGFRFNNGAILCADTKHTGEMVLYSPKLFPKTHASGAHSVFAIAGSTSFAKMAVNKCQRAIDKLRVPSLSKMEGAIEEAVLEIYKTHINPNPNRGLVGGPDFWLLIALWSPKDGIRTYYTSETAVVPFDVYHCSGSGEYLARYLLGPQVRGPNRGLNTVVSLACTVLSQIKSYDADCGGNSEFVLLTEDGYLGEMRQFNISVTEIFANKFHEMAEYLYTSIADVDQSDEQVDETFSHFKKLILPFRENYRRQKDAYNSLVEALQLEIESPGWHRGLKAKTVAQSKFTGARDMRRPKISAISQAARQLAESARRFQDALQAEKAQKRL